MSRSDNSRRRGGDGMGWVIMLLVVVGGLYLYHGSDLPGAALFRAVVRSQSQPVEQAAQVVQEAPIIQGNQRIAPDNAKIEAVTINVRAVGTYKVVIQTEELRRFWGFATQRALLETSGQAFVGWDAADVEISGKPFYYEMPADGTQKVDVYISRPPRIIAVQMANPIAGDFKAENNGALTWMDEDAFGLLQKEVDLYRRLLVAARAQVVSDAARLAVPYRNAATGETYNMNIGAIALDSLKASILADLGRPEQGGWTAEQVEFHIIGDMTLQPVDPLPENMR